MPGRTRKINRRQFAAGAAASATVAALGHRVVDTQGAESTAPSPDITIEVVATGLHDPRFVATDGEIVYLTEAGTGGDTPVYATAIGSTPHAGSPIGFRGTTGRLSRLDPDGTVTVIANGFQSYTFGENGEIVGPAGIALDGAGRAYVAIGAPGPFIAEIELTGEENVLVEVDLASGETRIVADLGRYEIEHDPDPMAIDSNLYGVAVRDGVAYVADAGGNSVLAVDIATVGISTFAVPGGIDAPFLGDGGNPQRAGEAKIDAVPSGIALGPDDRLYLTYLTGGPFPAGFARVDAFAPDGDHQPFATGLTMISDVAFASDGTAYAVMMSSDFVNGGPGGIVRVSKDGNHVVIVDGLQLPNGLAFDTNDVLYVTHKASFAAGGELLRITGVTTAAGTPLAGPIDPAAVGSSTDAGASTEQEVVHVVMSDMYFEPSAITIPANTDVLFTFENKGFIQHDILVTGTDVRSGVLAGGQHGEMIVNLSPGRYDFLCTQIGHRQAGMVGTLTVE
jgi:plastocyanin